MAVQKGKTSSPERILFLDGLRGVAAVCVVFYHLTQNYKLHLFPTANLAVDVFFCLSGYVIAANYYDRIGQDMGLKAYALKRIIRFYPMLIIGLLIGAAGIFLKHESGLADMDLPEIWQSGTINALFIPYINHSTVVNFGTPTTGNIFPMATPYWSLSFEMLINIVFFYYVVKFSKRLKTILIGATALYVITSLLFGAENGWGSDNFILGLPRVIFGFFAGVYAFLFIRDKTNSTFVEQVRSHINPNEWLYSLGVCAFLIMVFSIDLHIGRFIRIIHVLCVLSFPIIIFAASFIQLRNHILSRVMTFLGFLSYPIYCLHYPIIHLVEGMNKVHHLNLSSLQIMAMIICLSTVLSVLLGLYIDEPVRKYLNRRFFPGTQR